MLGGASVYTPALYFRHAVLLSVGQSIKVLLLWTCTYTLQASVQTILAWNPKNQISQSILHDLTSLDQHNSKSAAT